MIFISFEVIFLTGKYLCYEKINKTNSNSDLRI